MVCELAVTTTDGERGALGSASTSAEWTLVDRPGLTASDDAPLREAGLGAAGGADGRLAPEVRAARRGSGSAASPTEDELDRTTGVDSLRPGAKVSVVLWLEDGAAAGAWSL